MKNKYHNKACIVDGIRFASQAESRRYLELKALKEAGLIKDFEMQYPYTLQEAYRKCRNCNHTQKHIPGSRKKIDIICEQCGAKTEFVQSREYIADFKITHIDDHETIEDVKGSKRCLDPVFRLKKAWFEMIYQDKGIEIVIMNNRRR